MSALIFVYGTLKSGHRASWMMSNHGEKICNATVEGTIYDLGAFPGFLRRGDSVVHGEVWEVSRAAISLLDMYEGVGSLYDRVLVDAKNVDQDTMIEGVWIYEFKGEPSERDAITCGTWG